jgi:hypothetical protein
MKYLFFISILFIVSCGTSLNKEESEAERIQDSIKAEEDRLNSIDNANDFIVIEDSL